MASLAFLSCLLLMTHWRGVLATFSLIKHTLFLSSPCLKKMKKVEKIAHGSELETVDTI